MYIEGLIEKYRAKGLIIDTNLLLVLFVGIMDPKLIPKFKRTDTFIVEDFLTIRRFVDLFKKIVVTQSILTEVSNLIGLLDDKRSVLCHKLFPEYMKVLTEESVPSIELIVLEPFSKFGLADTGIIHQAAGNYLVLTDDFRLAGYMNSRNVDAINFNHIRIMNWEGFLT
jgi:hypothetical protein